MVSHLENEGFEIINSFYHKKEIDEILSILSRKSIEKKFGIREFLLSNQEITRLIFTSKMLKLINRFSPNANLIKSIYFDKPPNANWLVNWHQDLTINVKEKIDDSDFKNWRVTKERVVVQPPLKLLENIFTVRIHLDECTKRNGALKIVPKSHSKGIIPIKENLEEFKSKSISCEVNKGGILIMKPLLLHSSRRTENNLARRVIHLEFCNFSLPNGISWKEEIKLN